MSDTKDKLSVFDDNDEIMSWCDRDTYEGSETYVHLNGLYGLAVEFSDEITTLRADNERLRSALQDIIADSFSVYAIQVASTALEGK